MQTAIIILLIINNITTALIFIYLRRKPVHDHKNNDADRLKAQRLKQGFDNVFNYNRDQAIKKVIK